jgi:hypothetical protein
MTAGVSVVRFRPRPPNAKPLIRNGQGLFALAQLLVFRSRRLIVRFIVRTNYVLELGTWVLGLAIFIRTTRRGLNSFGTYPSSHS